MYVIILTLSTALYGQTDDSKVDHEKAERILNESDTLFRQRDYQKAAMGYLAASKLFYSLGDTLMQLGSEINYAKSLYFKGESIKAINLAISINKETSKLPVQESEAYIRLLRDIGIVFLSSQQELLTAEKVLHQAAKLLEITTYGDKEDRIQNYSNLAGCQYYLGKQNQAEKNYIKARDMVLLDSTLIKKNLPNILLGLSIIQSDIGKYKKALAGFEHILKLAKEEKDISREAWILGTMARVYAGQGLYNKSIEFNQQSIRLFESLGLREITQVIDSRSQIADLLIRLNRQKEAIPLLKLNYAVEQRSLGNDHPNHIYSYISLGKAYANINLDSANYFLSIERELVLKHYGDSSDRYASVYERQGDLWVAKKEYQQALMNYQLAFDKRRKFLGDNHPKTLRISHKICLSHLYRQDFDAAENQLELLISNSIIGDTDEKVALKYSSPEILIEAIGLKASVLFEKYKKEGDSNLMRRSFETFKDYDSLINTFRKEIGYSLDKSILWDNYRRNMDAMIPLLVERYRLNSTTNNFEKALLAVDKFKYITLNESLTKKQTSSFGIDELEEQKNGLLNQIVKVKNDLILAKDNPAETQRIKSILFNMNTQLDSLNTSSENNQVLGQINLNHIKDLAFEKTFISYYLTNKKLYIFLISEKENRIEEITIDSTFIKEVMEFNKIVAHPLTSGIDNFKILGKKLHDYLIAPIQNSLSTEHVVFLPDQLLHLVPFDALLTAESASSQFQYLPYLIRDLEISYTPSFSSISLLNDHNNVSYGQAVAIAPTFGKKETSTSNLTFSSTTRAGYAELLWTKKEASLIQELFDGKVLIGEAASKSQLIPNLDNPRILHFATHSVMDAQYSEFSHLLLTSTDSVDMEKNKLYAFEIYNSSLSTEMTVLGACNTGNGVLNEGEGIINLANSFFHAGSKSVVFSLWLANDQSTYELLSSFYRHLSDSKTKSSALRQAKLDYLEKADNATAHPFYWSHLVVSGDNKPLVFGEFNSRVIFASIILVLLILFVLVKNVIVPRSTKGEIT